MKNKILPLVFLILLLVGLAAVAAMGLHWHQTAAAPDQPIAFSHPVHVGKVGLACRDCHKGAAVSTMAGIPGMDGCLSCHNRVAVDRPEVKKLLAYHAGNEPVPWIKVHDLGWHAHFNHRRHIQAEIACEVCHGQVKAMESVRQVRSLSMGWCVACHRSSNAETDCLTCHK